MAAENPLGLCPWVGGRLAGVHLRIQLMQELKDLTSLHWEPDNILDQVVLYILLVQVSGVL